MRYSRDGLNLSPPLSWSEPPQGTRSFALIAVDVDTPIRVPITHWLVFNIPAATRTLAEGLPIQARFPDGMMQGWNWARRHGYIGPEPPWGKHRYVFTLYALDTILPPNPRLDKRALLRAIKGHALAEARLIGSYARPKAPLGNG